MSLTFDLSTIRFIKRISVGSSNPANPEGEAEIEAATELLNRCLNETPRGVILGIEKNFGLFNLGEHQVVLQWMVYHVGFPRKPGWL
ncbi:hypothetical protein [Desulfovibrio cuneatus]|uniref:hypothetical protein n=1 Tax=Desulfovibrio cuneatus TaxID=159728 RepID=UPI000426812D|nr:hypothetical protein [Desulfovibrio cuneatus]